MASGQPDSTSAGDANFSKAFQDLLKGERHAAALEKQLSSMEAKIEALLADAEKQQAESQASKASQATGENDDAASRPS